MYNYIKERDKMDLKKNGIFVPIMAVGIYFILRIFEWIGLNATQGYILQLMLIFYSIVYVKDHDKKTSHKILIILGGVFCLIGDMFLASAFRPLLEKLNLTGFRMPFGMLGFFIGNILWFISLCQHHDNISMKRFYKVFLLVAASLILLWFVTIFNTDNLLLSILALVYCFGLGLNLTYAIANLKQDKLYKVLLVGYIVFIFSDLWIGINDIKGFDTNPYVLGQDAVVIWLSYVIALACIFYFHASYQRRKNDS